MTTTRRPRRSFLAFRPLDLGAPSIRSLIFKLAIPAVIGLSANAAHHTINAYFVSFLGAQALAAVTLCLPIVMFVAAIGEGLGVGTAATIGRMLGAERIGRASSTASTVLFLLLPTGLFLTLLVLLGGSPILTVLGASEASRPLAEQYLQVMAFGSVLILLQIACDFVAISEGNTRFSMWTLIGGFALNILLDPILIFWADLGVAGAAYATILSQLVVLSVYAAYFGRRLGVVRVDKKFVALNKRILGPVLAVGSPTTLTTLVTGIAFTFVYAQSAKIDGDEAVAAIGITMRFLILGTLPMVGFVLGSQAVLGFAYGQGDYDRLRQATSFLLTATVVYAFVFGLLVCWFAEPIAGLFVSEPNAKSMAVLALVMVHLVFPFTAFRLVLLVLLQATAKPGLAALISLSAQGYLLFPGLLVLPPLMGFEGIPLALAAGIVIAGLLSAGLVVKFFLEPEGRVFGSLATLPSQ